MRSESRYDGWQPEVTCLGLRAYGRREIPIQTRYFDEASQIGFWKSVKYGFSIDHGRGATGSGPRHPVLTGAASANRRWSGAFDTSSPSG